MPKVTLENIEQKLKNNFEAKFAKNFLSLIREHLASDYADVFEEVYDDMLIKDFQSRMHPDDMSSPEDIKDEVVNYIFGQLDDAAQAAKFSGNKITINAIISRVYERPGPKTDDEVRLFYFYITGTPGKWVALGEREYDRIGSTKEEWGRFGTVNMIPYKKYENMYEKNNGSSRGWPAPASVLHPFSGVSAIRIFEETKKRFKGRTGWYTKKAVEMILKS